MVSNQLLEPHTKNGVSPAARPVTLAYHSLLNRTNRVDTHAGQYIVHPKSVHRGYKYPRHTPAAYIYTPVGVTSAIVFGWDLIVVVQVTKNKAYSVAYSAM